MSGWFLRDWQHPERTLVGTLTDVHNSGTFPPGQDGDTNLIVVPTGESVDLLINRNDRPNDGGVIECEVNVPVDIRDGFEDWLKTLIGQQVTAKGVYVDDEGHDDKTEIHPMDIMVGPVETSKLPGRDWIMDLAQRRGLVVGTTLLAYRYAAASDNRKHGAYLGTPLAQWTRPTFVDLPYPPRPAGSGWTLIAELKVWGRLNATAEVATGVHPVTGLDTAQLLVTCRGKDYGGTGWMLGEAVTYWSGNLQIALSALSFDFGKIGIGEVTSRHLLISNPGASTVELSVPSGPALSPFSWNEVPPRQLVANDAIDLQIDFSPRAAGTTNLVLTVHSNAQGSPHHIALHGSGKAITPQ